ncbi:MAG: S-layer homology domain-containing protein, partial [Armatimonadetes bacterium]|nr:S-layer homology domain-containing protein [Armatimonadota bacterium]
MRNIALALAVLMAVLAAAPLMAAPFRDTPSAHWALDALDQLASKGLVEGYPDTTYKGDRAATRYELAQVVARVVAKIEKMEPPDLSKYATKQDLQTLRRLVDEFRSELDALGVRVGKLEDTLAALEARVTELERVRVSGSVHEVAVFNGLDPQAEGGMRRHMSLNTGAPAHADFTTFPDRGTNSFVIQSATGLVSRADLDVTAKLSSEYQGGVRISAYNLVGSPNATYWAQPAPYLSNANLGFGNNLIAQLDHAWVDKKNTGFHATVGSFTPSRIGDYMYKGQSSPSLLGPDYLPLYGVDLTGGFKTSWLPRDVSYEVFGARLSSNQNLPGYGAVGVAAPGVQFGLNLGTEFNNKLRVNLNFHRVINDAVYMGGATGFIPLPNLWPTWRAVQFGAPSDAFLTGAWGATNAWGLAGGGVGPQDQNTWGIDVGYALPFWKMSQMSASFSSSTYRPFQGSVPAAYAATGQPTQVTGSLWNVEVMGPIGKTNWSLGYFSCSP